MQAEHVAKRPKLEQQEPLRGPALRNVVEIDGKSCAHEVAWPPGTLSFLAAISSIFLLFSHLFSLKVSHNEHTQPSSIM